MINISFLNGGENKNITAHEGETILEAARRTGILIETPCNGNGTCGKCQVKVFYKGRDDRLLACRTPATDGMVVEIAAQPGGEALQIKQEGKITQVAIDSPVRKHYVSSENYTEVFYDSQLVATEAGNTIQDVYGLAIDIGTTTLVVSLVDLLLGREIAVAGALNPQSRLGQDVLSRIKYASATDGLAAMNRLVIDQLNQLIGVVTRQAGISAASVYDAVVSGNTCMLHLLANVNPAGLGAYPYTPGITGNIVGLARHFGLQTAECSRIYLPPIISSYVGADISAGLFVAGLAQQTGRVLLIDIGTNGEMVLADQGLLVAASTAAGPAFEGMNITCGMRAEPGAVEEFHLAANGRKQVKTIHQQPARGICGSGLLDVVAALVQTGLISKSGRFTEPAGVKGFIAMNGKSAYEIADGIILSQKDVRQVQLAKGAIRAGIETLLNHCGINAGQMDQILIAGSFGYHLNPESLLAIGMLPAQFEGRIHFLGNTSKTGSQAFLLSREARRQIAGIVGQVTTIDLATVDGFDKMFIRCLDF